MSFIELKKILPQAFEDNPNKTTAETMIGAVEKATGSKMPDLPPFEWAALALQRVIAAQGK